jgi:hypothetical protein
VGFNGIQTHQLSGDKYNSKFKGGNKDFFPDAATAGKQTLFGLLYACQPIIDPETGIVADLNSTSDFIISVPEHQPALMNQLMKVMKQGEKCNKTQNELVLIKMKVMFWVTYMKFEEAKKEHEEKQLKKIANDHIFSSLDI